MYIRKTHPERIRTEALLAELEKLNEAKRDRNRKLHTTGRYHRLATAISRRLFTVREALRSRGCPEERLA